MRAFLDAHDDLARVAVRINPAGTPDGREDLAMLAGARRAAAVVVPKAGDVRDSRTSATRPAICRRS